MNRITIPQKTLWGVITSNKSFIPLDIFKKIQSIEAIGDSFNRNDLTYTSIEQLAKYSAGIEKPDIHTGERIQWLIREAFDLFLTIGLFPLSLSFQSLLYLKNFCSLLFLHKDSFFYLYSLKKRIIMGKVL